MPGPVAADSNAIVIWNLPRLSMRHCHSSPITTFAIRAEPGQAGACICSCNWNYPHHCVRSQLIRTPSETPSGICDCIGNHSDSLFIIILSITDVIGQQDTVTWARANTLMEFELSERVSHETWLLTSIKSNSCWKKNRMYMRSKFMKGKSKNWCAFSWNVINQAVTSAYEKQKLRCQYPIH